MSDLLDDLYLSPDEDAQEESSFPQNYEEKIVENTENFEEIKEEEETNSTQAPEDESLDDEEYTEEYNEIIKKEEVILENYSSQKDEVLDEEMDCSDDVLDARSEGHCYPILPG